MKAYDAAFRTAVEYVNYICETVVDQVSDQLDDEADYVPGMSFSPLPHKAEKVAQHMRDILGPEVTVTVNKKKNQLEADWPEPTEEQRTQLEDSLS
jgi:hypothetical protein